MQQNLSVPENVVSLQEKAVSKRPKIIRVAIAIALSVALIWLSYYPHFSGEYLGDAGRTEVKVIAARNEVHVTITEIASATVKSSTYGAEKTWYTLHFGENLEQQAVIYRPGGHYELVAGCRSMVIFKQDWITRLAESHPYLCILAMMLGMIGYMFFVLNAKAKLEPEAIYPIWLAYFGALLGSALVLFAAGEKGIFGINGEPRNNVARAILKAANFFLDIGPEFWALIGVLFLVVFVQWFAYIVSGLSGAARRPRYIFFTWKCVALLIAKALIGASAIVLSIEIIGDYFNWVSTQPSRFAENILTSMLLLFFGICMFCVAPLRRGGGRPVGRKVRRIHRFMRRHMRQGPNQVMTRVQKRGARRMPWQ